MLYLFEHHNSLDECVCFLYNLRARYGSHKQLGLAALKHHDFPKLGQCKDWLSPRGINRTGLRLVENNHGGDENYILVKDLDCLMIGKETKMSCTYLCAFLHPDCYNLSIFTTVMKVTEHTTMKHGCSVDKIHAFN